MSHSNKDISGRHIVMSLQQIDICEQLLGTAARGGHVFSACTTAKQFGLLLLWCERFPFLLRGDVITIKAYNRSGR